MNWWFKRRRKKKALKLRSAQPGKLTVEQALEQVPDETSDGAWWAMLEEMTGLDAGDISSELEKLNRMG